MNNGKNFKEILTRFIFEVLNGLCVNVYLE